MLILGPSGAGKSDLTLRLLNRGFVLIADDQVDIDHGLATAPNALAGLLEVRGLGIVRVPHQARAKLRLAVCLTGNGDAPPRMPYPQQHPTLGLPMVHLDAFAASAPDRVALALDCALGVVAQHAGAFAA